MTDRSTVQEPMWLGVLADRPVRAGVLRRGDGQLCVVETFALSRVPLAETTRAFRVLGGLERLVHPHVVRVVSHETVADSLVVTSAYVAGESLTSLLLHAATRAMRVPVDVGCRLVVDVLGGLAALHGLRDTGDSPIEYVHGEVCPRNILVGADGRARLAHPCRPGHDPANPRPPALPYAAPEVLAGRALTVQADLYSVGALLFHVLDGGPPFDADTPAILAAHAAGGARAPKLPVDIGWAERLVPIVARALTTDPSHRYGSASDMAADVRLAVTTQMATTEHASIVLHDLCGGSLRRRANRFGEP